MRETPLAAKPDLIQPDLTPDQRNSTGNWAGSSIGRWWAGSLIHRVGITVSVAIAGIMTLATIAGNVPAQSAAVIITLLPAAIVDLHEHRLPNRWVGASVAIFLITVVVLSMAGRPTALTQAGVGALLMAGPILTLHIAGPDSMGFGDVKAAAALGLAVGSVDWRLSAVALTVASGIAGVTGIAARVRTIAFGPSLVVGASAALLTADRWLALPLTGAVSQ